MGPIKSADFLKTVKDGNRSKLLKQLSPDRGFSVKKFGIQQDSPLPGGRIRMKLSHVDVNCHEEGTGYTPLIIAILNGNKEMVDDLIFHCADVNVKDNRGNTPLHMAVFAGKLDMVDVLVQNRAKTNQQNSDGNSPLHIACQTDHDNRVQILLKLLMNGCTASLLNKANQTALDVAAMYSKTDAVSVLLDHDPELKKNTLAIVEASVRGQNSVVEMLLDYGIDPNGVDTSKEFDTRPLIEAVRFLRFVVAETLVKYGADPTAKNGMMESAESLSKTCKPREVGDKFTKIFEEYKAAGPVQSPRFLKILDRGASLQAPKDYPQLPNVPDWTRNSPEYCNSCTPNAPNTNILNEEPASCWIAAEVHHAWTVLDLKYNHTLTGITILGWDSPQMLRSFELQRAPSLEGPWSNVASYTCLRMGNSRLTDPGVPQTFTDFTATSRYWRLELMDNHGGRCICIHGIRLFGADGRIPALLEGNMLDQYADCIIALGFNSYKRFLLMNDDHLKDMVPCEEDRKSILKLLDRERPKEFHPASLSWKVTPVISINAGEIIPDFSVKSTPGVKTKVELLIDTGELLIGNTVVTLQSHSLTEPSTATFTGIKINRGGNYKLIIRCVEFPRTLVETPEPIEVKAKPKLRNSVELAFDDVTAMLEGLQASLDF